VSKRAPIVAGPSSRRRGRTARWISPERPPSYTTPCALAIRFLRSRWRHHVVEWKRERYVHAYHDHRTLPELMAANLRALLAAYAGLWRFPASAEVPTDLRDPDVRLELRRRLAPIQLELFGPAPTA
jgi:hypothetical protein